MNSQAGGVQSAKKCSAQRRKQKRSYRCPQVGRTVVLEQAQLGLPWRDGCAHAARASPELPDHRQRSDPSHLSVESGLSQLGHPPAGTSTIPVIESSGWASSRKPVSVAEPNDSTSNWTCCSTCASKRAASCWRRVASIVVRQNYRRHLWFLKTFDAKANVSA